MKDLLLKDLCARLPYNVKVKIPFMESPLRVLSINTNGVTWVRRDTGYPLEIDWENCKPYLFPLSSITEEQYYEMMGCSSEDCLEHMEIVKSLRECTDFTHWPLYEYRVIDCFNKNHLDYRGLIPKGLAIDATGLNIY